MKEIRVIAIDDFPFQKGKDRETTIVGVVTRNGNRIEGILSGKVEVDGDDSTSSIIRMIKNSKFKDQIKLIILNGIAVGGFNVVDVEVLNKKLGIPVLIVMRKRPRMERIKAALMKRRNWREKLERMKKAGEVHLYKCELGKAYFQFFGMSEKEARKFMDRLRVYSVIPEPLRIAHLICSGIGLGESRGRV